MIEKEIKEYSKRQRIDINKSDGFNPGDMVVVLTANEYQKIKDDVLELKDKLTAKDKELEILQSQEQNLKEIIQDVTAPIDERYQKEIEKKDNQIEHLTDELNTLRTICNQFNLDLMGLGAIDIVIRGKHKDLITNFNNSIWVTPKDNAIDSDARVLPGKDDNTNKE